MSMVHLVCQHANCSVVPMQINFCILLGKNTVLLIEGVLITLYKLKKDKNDLYSIINLAMTTSQTPRLQHAGIIDNRFKAVAAHLRF